MDREASVYREASVVKDAPSDKKLRSHYKVKVYDPYSPRMCHKSILNNI